MTEEGKKRKLSGTDAKIVKWIAIAMSLYQLAQVRS